MELNALYHCVASLDVHQAVVIVCIIYEDEAGKIHVQLPVFALVQYADHGSADAQFNRLTDKIVRDTVEAAVEFDVVVDAYLGLFPLGILVRCGG
uniref:Uncharacterized protein n=1 Tax=Candidatus Kentrum sp. LPFa TaxID=2126335 RepID=A0A450Y3I7_9GAMM|nr:MAG: hypothetical protein BECKLPF1236A_GA0070988_104863 [Candidatus Kentron sp. LPFa]VFK36121.1 MAG: hypothetical protein BECKLPF1236C_GA0070990_104913 [Candidatus Kentron sp. LPFa]